MITARHLLAATILVLTCVPRLNVSVGPAPLYAIDLLLVATFVSSLRYRPVYHPRFPLWAFILVILCFAGISEALAAISLRSIMEPVYMFARTLLAASLFFSASRIIRTERDLRIVIQAAVLGLIVTSALMILSSLPFTRSIANSVLSLQNLDPGSEFFIKAQSEVETGVRGRSMVGQDILSGAFINCMWPLAMLLYRWPRLPLVWRRIALVAVFLAPLGVLASYSRGAILGMLLVICGVLYFGAGGARRVVVAVAAAVVLLISAVGWGSEYFFFQRLENRTRAMLENPYEDERETERIYAYIEPFQYIAKQPQFLYSGGGLARGRMMQRGYGVVGSDHGGRNLADHAVFAKAVYTYGLVAAIAYVLLLGGTFLIALYFIRRLKGAGGIPESFAQLAFASLLGLLSWFVLGHAAVSQPRGAMMLFFLVGLTCAVGNVSITTVLRRRRLKERRQRMEIERLRRMTGRPEKKPDERQATADRD